MNTTIGFRNLVSALLVVCTFGGLGCNSAARPSQRSPVKSADAASAPAAQREAILQSTQPETASQSAQSTATELLEPADVVLHLDGAAFRSGTVYPAVRVLVQSMPGMTAQLQQWQRKCGFDWAEALGHVDASGSWSNEQLDPTTLRVAFQSNVSTKATRGCISTLLPSAVATGNPSPDAANFAPFRLVGTGPYVVAHASKAVARSPDSMRPASPLQDTLRLSVNRTPIEGLDRIVFAIQPNGPDLSTMRLELHATSEKGAQEFAAHAQALIQHAPALIGGASGDATRMYPTQLKALLSRIEVVAEGVQVNVRVRLDRQQSLPILGAILGASIASVSEYVARVKRIGAAGQRPQAITQP